MNENREHCKAIALALEEYYNGEIYRCPECGEEFNLYNDGEYQTADVAEDGIEKATCPSCGYVSEDSNNFEQLSLWDYFTDDVLDVKYLMNSDRTLNSVKILVAFGGPNIYIDTESGNVELYWWGDRASYPIDTDVRNEIDAIFEELFNC